MAISGCASIDPTNREFGDPQVSDADSTYLDEVHERCYGYIYGREGYRLDYNEALRWCRESAESGSSSGQTLLAEIYYNGLGVDQDYRKALYWYTSASYQFHPHATYSLFLMFANGQGVERDNGMAFMYLERAVEHGSEKAEKVLAGFDEESFEEPPNEELIQEKLKEHGVVEFDPKYPKLARVNGIEGYAIVSYCVDREGRTLNIHVVESWPVGVFESASEAAIRKFRYLPALEGGVPVERHGVVREFDFQ
tara:strand:+ start:58410 stop:59165 length:756 start_codon:yes stop_codon:yes gene_type:complete